MTSRKKRRKYKRSTPPETYGYDPVRDKGITELYIKKGWTLAQIGKKHDLTRERVRQVIKREITKLIKRGLRKRTYPNPDHKSVNQLVKDEIREVLKSRAKNRVLSKIEEAKEIGVKPERFTSRADYAKKLGISISQLRQYAPEAMNKIRENMTVGHGGKKWSRYYLRCKECGTASIPHHSHGYCENCFTKTEIFKDLQRASRLRNLERWKPRQDAYLRQYYDKKNYGGNREKALKRDKYKCVECSMTETEHQKKYGERIRVMHIGDPNDHSLTNLATICRPCFMIALRAKRAKSKHDS